MIVGLMRARIGLAIFSLTILYKKKEKKKDYLNIIKNI